MDRRRQVEAANTTTMGGALLLARLLAQNGVNLSQNPQTEKLRATQLATILRQGGR